MLRPHPEQARPVETGARPVRIAWCTSPVPTGGGYGGDYVGSAVAESTTSLAGNGSTVESRRTPGSITITY